jgi:hypothetical protein
MRKLKLNLERLRVELFDTAVRPDERGTVRGAGATYNADCQTWENPWCGYQTYEVGSCGGGCTGIGTGTGGTVGDNPSDCGGNTCLYASCDGYTC